jgi:uncharacterized protein with HEPN domain
MKKDDRVFLSHIAESIAILEETVNGMDERAFLENVTVQDASIRRLEIIGEAVKNLSPEFKEKHSDIEWKKIAGLRDVLIHAYFGIDLELTWRIIKDDLPVLKNRTQMFLKEFE